MKNLLFAICLVSATLAVSSAFLGFGSSKNKTVTTVAPPSGCNPNPCKHGGNCTLGRDLKTGVCSCPEGYHGNICEKKNGCYGKPCRKGKCHIADMAKAPMNFTCKCNEGIVGKKCDTVDPCGKGKNPCKQGKCVIDAKLKAVCECPTGMSGSKCDKRNCTIVEFKGKHFEHKGLKTYVDKSFEEKLHKLDALAKICQVKVKVVRSFTQQIKKEILVDDTDYFYSGNACEIEIYDNDDKLLCNQICLGKLPIPQKPAKCLMDGLQSLGIKRSFSRPEIIYNPDWSLKSISHEKLKEHHQVGCKEKKF